MNCDVKTLMAILPTLPEGATVEMHPRLGGRCYGVHVDRKKVGEIWIDTMYYPMFVEWHEDDDPNTKHVQCRGGGSISGDVLAVDFGMERIDVAILQDDSVAVWNSDAPLLAKDNYKKGRYEFEGSSFVWKGEY